MGGIVCHIHRNAILRFEGVPTKEKDKEEFDAQMRKLFSQESIAKAIEENGTYMRVCDLLALKEWKDTERQELYDFLEATYPD